MVLGLIPDCKLENVASAGNAAGTGARIALLNRQARLEIESVVQSIEKIETATEAKFQEYFVDAMAFPHKKDRFTELFKAVSRPAAKGGLPAAARGRRRRHGVGLEDQAATSRTKGVQRGTRAACPVRAPINAENN